MPVLVPFGVMWYSAAIARESIKSTMILRDFPIVTDLSQLLRFEFIPFPNKTGSADLSMATGRNAANQRDRRSGVSAQIEHNKNEK